MKNSATSAKPATPDVTAWMSAGSRNMESLGEARAQLMQGAFDLAQEVLTFSQARLQADIEAWQALSACKEPGDLIECQKQFAEKAASTYLEEANKLAAKTISFVTAAAAPFGGTAGQA